MLKAILCASLVLASTLAHCEELQLTDSEIAGYDAYGIAVIIVYNGYCFNPPVSSRLRSIAKQVLAKRSAEVNTGLYDLIHFLKDGGTEPDPVVVNWFCRDRAPGMERLNHNVR